MGKGIGKNESGDCRCTRRPWGLSPLINIDVKDWKPKTKTYKIEKTTISMAAEN